MFAVICTVLALLIVTALWIVLYDTHHFVTVKYTFSSEKVKKPTCMVMLSDLHNCQYGRENRQLLDAIDALAPDMILLAGDMITAKKGDKFDRTLLFLEKLVKKYPVYYAYGNHEQKLALCPDRFGDMAQRYEEGLGKLGLKPLLNAHCDLPERGICVYGLEIGADYYQRFRTRPMDGSYLEGLLGKPSDMRCNVLLAHNPDYFARYAEWGADLVLSGHTHGGIVRLPFLGGVISPACCPFPKYDGGLFEEYGSKMVLGRGIGGHSVNVRMFNPAELLSITLTPGTETSCNAQGKKVK